MTIYYFWEQEAPCIYFMQGLNDCLSLSEDTALKEKRN